MGRKKLLVLVLALVMVFATFSPAMAAYYNDTAGHWAERDINWATEKGYLKGDGNGYFRPEDTVTRAEYVTGVNRLINSASRSTIGYPDVRTSDWFYDEMAKGVYNGIIDDSRYNFRPNEAITRDEAARIVARAYRLTNYADAATIFKDYNNIANKGEVGALVTKKVLNGWPDGNYYPNKTLTRAEYAKILRASVENLGLPSKPTAPVATVPSDWWAGYPGYGYGYGYNCELELSKLLSAINSGERYLRQTDVYTADSLAILRRAVEAGRTTYNTYKNYRSDYRYGYYGYDLRPWNYTTFSSFESAARRDYPGVFTTAQLRDIYNSYRDGRYYDDYYGYYGYYGINPNSYNSLESFRRAMKNAYGSRVTDSEIERIYRDRANYRYYDRDRYPYYYYDTCPYQGTIDAATKKIDDAIKGLVRKTEKTYTVTFNVDGGSSVPAQEVKAGEKATKPEDPTKEGFTFKGWYTDSTFGTEFDFSKPINANTTVYAKFEEDEALSSDTSVIAVSAHKGTIGDTVPMTANINNEEGKITITIAKTHQIGDVVQVQIDELADGAKAEPKIVKASDNWKFTVTAEDGTTTKEYTIVFEQEPSDNINLKSLTVAGQSVDVAGGKTTYDVELSAGTEVNTENITAEVHNSGTVSEVTKNGDTYTFTATAQDGVTTQEYTVNVTFAESTEKDSETEAVEENSEVDTTDELVTSEGIQPGQGSIIEGPTDPTTGDI